ncbi:hypothetical protein G9A89_008443 [Geosiphon pyriformis]|nr:hypothetical protein G9A89_008443 [Geosiphon pyriformis]
MITDFGLTDDYCVHDGLDQGEIGADSLSVYTNGFLSNLGSVGCRAGAATFFEDIYLGLSIGVLGLMLFTLVELQAIALALECVSLLCSVDLFLDSQSALNACRSELGLACFNYYNQCWIKCCHITNVICNKNLRVSWHKVKSHSGVSENEQADAIAGDTSLSNWYLLPCLNECFIMANGSKVGSDSRFLASGLLSKVDWLRSSLVWQPDLHMSAGFTSRLSANTCTYFMKALHYQLPVIMWKCLYNRSYPSVLCLYYNDLEVPNHVFSCKIDDSVQYQLLEFHLLTLCSSDSFLSIVLYKDFVFKDWFCKVVTIFHNPKIASLEIVKFVPSFSLAFRSNVWLICAKHCAYMEKNGLILLNGSVFVLVSGLVSELSAGVVKLLGIADAFGV